MRNLNHFPELGLLLALLLLILWAVAFVVMLPFELFRMIKGKISGR